MNTFYEYVRIVGKDVVERLKEYPQNSLFIRMGIYTNNYALISNKNIANSRKIIEFIEKGSAKYEIFFKNTPTKLYIDCEKEIEKEVSYEEISKFYIEFNNLLKEKLISLNINTDNIIYLDSSRYIDKNKYKISLHVIVNNAIFTNRKVLLEVIKNIKEYIDSKQDYYNFIDTEPYHEEMQLFRLPFSISDKDITKSESKIIPFAISSHKIITLEKEYIYKHFKDMLVGYYDDNYNILDNDFLYLKSNENNILENTNKVGQKEEEEEFGLNIKIPQRVLDFVNKKYNNIFEIKIARRLKIDLIRKKKSYCIICDREHERNNAYLLFNKGILLYKCYQNINKNQIIYNIYEDIDILYNELNLNNNTEIKNKTLSPSPSALSLIMNENKIISKDINIIKYERPKKVTLNNAFYKKYFNELIKLNREKYSNKISKISKKRYKKRTKEDNDKEIEDIITKVSKYSKKKYESQYIKHNRNIIKLYSEINKDLEDKKINDNELYKVLGEKIDTNKSRLRKLIKISDYLFEYKELYNSNILIPLYIFKNINLNNIEMLFSKLKKCEFLKNIYI